MLDLKIKDYVCADLHGANLSGRDLRGADMRGADLREADLECADLRGAKLSGAKFYACNLEGAQLSGATVSVAVPMVPQLMRKLQACFKLALVCIDSYERGDVRSLESWVVELAGLEGKQLRRAVGVEVAAWFILAASEPDAPLPSWDLELSYLRTWVEANLPAAIA